MALIFLGLFWNIFWNCMEKTNKVGKLAAEISSRR